MNSPIKDGDQIFDTSMWSRFISPDGHIQTITRGLTLDENPWDRHSCLSSNPSSRSDTTIRNSTHPQHHKDQLKYFGFLDPAMGKATTRDGDYAAIVTVGKAPDNTLYVMDVWMERASPMKQVAQVFALHQKYKYEKFGFECNGFQETLGTFIRDEQTRMKTAGDHWHLPIEKHNNHHSKHSRISLLEPHIIAGSILFQQDLKHEFYIQADEYNGSRSNHDDGLDALASCIEMIRSSEKNISQIKSIKRKAFR